MVIKATIWLYLSANSSEEITVWKTEIVASGEIEG